jgi:hypothetical protein
MWAIKFRLANRLHCAARAARFQLLVILLFPQPKFIAFFLPLYCIIGPHFHLCGASMTLLADELRMSEHSHTHTHARSRSDRQFLCSMGSKKLCDLRTRAPLLWRSRCEFSLRAQHTHTETERRHSGMRHSAQLLAIDRDLL